MLKFLSWGHWIELLTIKDINKIKYYIKQSELMCLTTRQLREKIKNKEYERLDEKTKFKLKEEKDKTIGIIINFSSYYLYIFFNL